MLLGIATAVAAVFVGLLVGHLWGAASTRSARWRHAIQGANELATQVESANVEVAALIAVVARLNEGLAQESISPTQVVALSDATLTFDAGQVVHRGVGTLNTELQCQLVEYLALTSVAAKQKERLSLLLGKRGRDLLAILSTQSDNPQVLWAAQLSDGPKGPIARVVRLHEPFGIRGDWPSSISLVSPRGPQNVSRSNPMRELGHNTSGVVPIAPDSLGPLERQSY